MSYEPPAPRAPAAEEPADLVAREWRRRTQAEYGSAAIAHQVTLWLLQEGGPPDLIRDGLRIVEDELSHSELSAAVMGASGGAAAPPVIDGASLVLAAGQDPRGALVAAITRFFCVGETVAVPLFRMLRERARVPVARRALDRILRDEARHRQFGWDTLDWLLLHDEDDVARRVAIELPAVLADVKAAYGTAAEQPSPTLREDVMAWGMAGPAEYGFTLTVALDRDVVPRFSARGLAVAGARRQTDPLGSC
ncbi:MAG TPA: ferritin-like domain-containing protein [Acidimicrobiales bacterium]|nr:ferritin-like domain-containing protein [Acidimicrobiales bacterium]